MKSIYCRVATCYNVMTKDGLKFFTFPRDPTLCEQWVLFCQCSQTSEWFYSGGVFALKNHSICANHFDPTAFDIPGTRLIPEAVPGQRYGPAEEPAAALLEETSEEQRGQEEVVVKQEELTDGEIMVLDAEQIPDQVLVEMLSSEEIKEEHSDEVEDDEPVFAEELPPIEEEINEEARKSHHRSDCIFSTGKVSNFEERYKRQIMQNKKMESLIANARLKYTQKTEKLRKLNDLLSTKRRRKHKLQRKLNEYKRRGPAALLKSVDSAKDESCSNESDSSIDDANAWW